MTQRSPETTQRVPDRPESTPMGSAHHTDDLQGLGRPNGVLLVPRRPEGFLRRPEGCRRRPAGFLRRPEGFMRTPAGFLRRPEGFLRRPAGFLRRPAGFLRRPAGFMRRPAGFMRRPQEVRRRPDGLLRRPKRLMIVQSQPQWVLVARSSALLSRVRLGHGLLTRLSVPRTTHLARGVKLPPARGVGSRAIRLTRTQNRQQRDDQQDENDKFRPASLDLLLIYFNKKSLAAY